MVKTALYNTGIAVTGTTVITTTVADIGVQFLLVVLTVVVTPLLTLLMQKLGATKAQTELAEEKLNLWTAKIKEETDAKVKLEEDKTRLIADLEKAKEENRYLRQQVIDLSIAESE